MKNPNHYLKALMLSLGLQFGAHGAGDASSNIVEIAQEAGVFQTLLAASQAAGLVDDLSNAVPKTVFAPTDAAFAKLPSGTVESLLLPENQGKLRQIIRYHLVDGTVLSKDLKDGVVATRSTAGLKVSLANGVSLNDSAKVMTADVMASNGVIHIIDSVLLPPAQNVVDLAVADPELSTVVAALSAAGLVDVVKNGNPFTLLLPTNAAFAKLPAGTVESLLEPANLPVLSNILLYHVVNASLFSNQLKNGPVAMANGGSVTVNTAGPVFGFEGGAANPVAVDLLGYNGVIHKIDTVLMPSGMDLVAKLSADARFSTLVTAVGLTGLADTLKGLKGGTVFAPTNAAFDALPSGALNQLLQPENLELLRNVLLYHVVLGNRYAGDLQTNVYPTPLGVDLPVEVSGAGVRVDHGPMVVEANHLASNGVIHAIDAVILPPLNLADQLAQDPSYSTLVAALKAGGLFDTLNGVGPFTLFAPTNAAFEKLPAGTIATLLQPGNLGTLQSILLAHAVAGKQAGGSLLQAPLTTLQGKTLTIHWSGGHLMIGSEAVISGTDFPVWNGVIHKIDTVLMP
jgi:transforming growth factor-beta-induced protein